MRFIFLFLLFISFTAFGQYKSFKIGPKGDTLNRLDMQGKKQGPWVLHYDEIRGEPGFEEEGYFVNSKKEGEWRKFSLQGDLLAVENFRWGNKNGRCRYFTAFGSLVREEAWKAVNPDNPYDTVPIYDLEDPTKVIKWEVMKLEGFALKHGVWKFYDPNQGTVTKTEKWFLDKPAVSTGTTTANGDEDLRPVDIKDNTAQAKADTAKKTAIKPKEVMDFEKKNSGKKKVKVRDGKTGY
jgi:hypothetical protein